MYNSLCVMLESATGRKTISHTQAKLKQAYRRPASRQVACTWLLNDLAVLEPSCATYNVIDATG